MLSLSLHLTYLLETYLKEFLVVSVAPLQFKYALFCCTRLLNKLINNFKNFNQINLKSTKQFDSRVFSLSGLKLIERVCSLCAATLYISFLFKSYTNTSALRIEAFFHPQFKFLQIQKRYSFFQETEKLQLNINSQRLKFLSVLLRPILSRTRLIQKLRSSSRKLDIKYFLNFAKSVDVQYDEYFNSN